MATRGDGSGYADGDGDEREDPAIGWRNRVRFADHWKGRTFAYRPNDVLTTRPQEALDLARRTFEGEGVRIAEQMGPFARLIGVPDPLGFVQDLRYLGIVAHPNHVLFIHCQCCPPHPALGCGYGLGGPFGGVGFNPASINPASINPASINPASINPASINPASINPASINPADPRRVTGVRRSSARPASPTDDEAVALSTRICTKAVESAPKVVVLDTGLASKAVPAVLADAPAIRPVGGEGGDEPDNDGNDLLDPAAGHGTFIAGVINQVAPGCDVTVHRVVHIYGDVDEFTAAALISALAEDCDDRTILSLSFGGATMDDEAAALAYAVRRFQAKGGVVVASAGNDATCVPSYPAALPGVVSVGALASWGPAPFTNYGPWVRACAPGVDLVSLFFEGFAGLGQPGPDGVDPDNFAGWARWSGTSFAAPVVVGALGRMMMWSGCTAGEAVARVIDAPELFRLPNLGTVVNVI